MYLCGDVIQHQVIAEGFAEAVNLK